MAWVLALIVCVAVAVRELAEYRYATSTNRDVVVTVINGFAIGAAVVAIGAVFLAAGEWEGLVFLAPGLLFLWLAVRALRLHRSPFFDPACEAHLWHEEYERCKFCGGTRAETPPPPTEDKPRRRFPALLIALVAVAISVGSNVLADDESSGTFVPDPYYELDLVAENIPAVIEDQLGEWVTRCEQDHIDRFVCEIAESLGGPGPKYCYRFILGPTGERDLQIGRTHYHDYEVRYLMIPQIPEPSDPWLYRGAPYRCRPKGAYQSPGSAALKESSVCVVSLEN